MAKAGWSYYGITQVLNRRGIPVRESAVRRWVDGRIAERERLANRERRRTSAVSRKIAAGGPWIRADASPKYRMARLLALAEVGVRAGQIAKVIHLDFGDVLTEHEVKRAVETGRPPRKWRVRAGEGEQ